MRASLGVQVCWSARQGCTPADLVLTRWLRWDSNHNSGWTAVLNAAVAARWNWNMTSEERFTRMENILDHVVDRKEQLDAALTTLAESHIKTQEELQTTPAMIAKLNAQVATTERQWQAYINTLHSRQRSDLFGAMFMKPANPEQFDGPEAWNRFTSTMKHVLAKPCQSSIFLPT